jgi:DNA polymerase III subunit beta
MPFGQHSYPLFQNNIPINGGIPKMARKSATPTTAAAVAEPTAEEADHGQLTEAGPGETVLTDGKKKAPKKAADARFKAVATIPVARAALSQALSQVARALAARSTLPVLANVFVRYEHATSDLTLASTDLSMLVVTKIHLDNKAPENLSEGQVVETTIPLRLWADLVGTFPNETVYLGLGEYRSTVTCGTSTTEIAGIEASEYPSISLKATNGLPFSFTAGELKEALAQVTFAASQDEARPALQAVSFNFAEDGVTMAATDGFRISVCKLGYTDPVEGKIPTGNHLVPAGALADLVKLLADPDQPVALGFVPGKVIFTAGDLSVGIQMVDGNFPDYKIILPKSFKMHAVVNAAVLIKAIKQAEVIARSGNNVARLKWTPGGENPACVEVSAVSEETGSNQATVDATLEGPAIEIAFNVRFLREALEAMKSPTVAFDANDHKSPARIIPVGDDSFTHVIMPMHLG